MTETSTPRRLPGTNLASASPSWRLLGPLGAAAAFIVLVLVSWPFFTVGEYERTVVTRFGQFSTVAGPGLHFRVPIITNLEAFPVNIQVKTRRTSASGMR